MLFLSRKNKNLFENYLTEKEYFQLIKTTLISIFAPFIFAYGFLALNGGLVMFNSRAYFYIPFFIIIIFAYRNKRLKTIELIELAKKREAKKE
jgi:hypothetical protein